MPQVLVAALYKFVPIEDVVALRTHLMEVCADAEIRGTLLLAPEGINGTIAGPEDGVRAVLAALRSDTRFADLEHKESWTAAIPFEVMKVRLKKEIVTLGVGDVDVRRGVGTYVKPQDWNALISQPDVLVVDTRNDYEIELGSFAGAVNPETRAFGELPAWLAQRTDLTPQTPIAMFCTGGIRCEKATAYLREKGFEKVYHLEGGILKYLEVIPEAQSLWQGECFVFDQRLTVDHQLQRGGFVFCSVCGRGAQPTADGAPAYCLHCEAA